MTWFAAGVRGPLNWPREITAGITLAALAIPLNIGYAQIAGLPPITGLYTAIVPMLVFALLCSSRQLVASPDAPIAALIASLLTAIAARPGSSQYVELAYAQALVCAAVFLLFFTFKLGFLANFLSEPVLVGFIAGLAGAALASGQKPLPPGRQLILAAVFVVIGSLGVLTPYATALSEDGPQHLQRMRDWMIRHNGALTLLLILVFALLFLAKGLHTLLT